MDILLEVSASCMKGHDTFAPVNGVDVFAIGILISEQSVICGRGYMRVTRPHETSTRTRLKADGSNVIREGKMRLEISVQRFVQGPFSDV